MTEEPAIVLVEDSPDDVAFFTHALENAGWAPLPLQVIADGAEALEFFFATGRYVGRPPAVLPKIIILDLKLPKIGGLEVLRRLKSDLRTHTIPVVVFSSSQEEPDFMECYRLGANSYLVKPMNYDAFGQSVRLIGQYWLQFNQTTKP